MRPEVEADPGLLIDRSDAQILTAPEHLAAG